MSSLKTKLKTTIESALRLLKAATINSYWTKNKLQKKK